MNFFKIELKYKLIKTFTSEVKQIDSTLQFCFNKIGETKSCLIKEVRKRQIMSETLNKYNAAFDYADKALLVLLAQ